MTSSGSATNGVRAEGPSHPLDWNAMKAEIASMSGRTAGAEEKALQAFYSTIEVWASDPVVVFYDVKPPREISNPPKRVRIASIPPGESEVSDGPFVEFCALVQQGLVEVRQSRMVPIAVRLLPLSPTTSVSFAYPSRSWASLEVHSEGQSLLLCSSRPEANARLFRLYRALGQRLGWMVTP